MKDLKLFLLGVLSLVCLNGCETVDGLVDGIGDIKIPYVTSSPPPSTEDLITDNCPPVEIVEDLSSFNDFSDFNKPTEENLVSRLYMTDAQRECSFSETSMTVDLQVDFEGRLGFKAFEKDSRESFISYPFFVAVLSPKEEILAKEVFSASVNFERNQSVQQHLETMRQIIPLDDPEDGQDYKILVGFQLGRDQLAYNRFIIEQTTVAPEAAFGLPGRQIEINNNTVQMPQESQPAAGNNEQSVNP